jgi:hypothetical protein
MGQIMTKFYCPKCGTELKLENDVSIYYCPVDQFAFGADFLAGLVGMAADWRDSADERVYGPSGS